MYVHACRCLGWRPIAEDGTPGDYEFLTYQETQGWLRRVVLESCGQCRTAEQEEVPCWFGIRF